MYRLHQPNPAASTLSMQPCHPCKCQSDSHHSSYPIRNRITDGTITVYHQTKRDRLQPEPKRTSPRHPLYHQSKRDRKQPEPKPVSPSYPLQVHCTRTRHSSIKIARSNNSPRIMLRNRNRNRNRKRNTWSELSPRIAPPLECGGPVCREAMEPMVASTRFRLHGSRPRLDQPHHMFRCRPAHVPG